LRYRDASLRADSPSVARADETDWTRAARHHPGGPRGSGVLRRRLADHGKFLPDLEPDDPRAERARDDRQLGARHEADHRFGAARAKYLESGIYPEASR